MMLTVVGVALVPVPAEASWWCIFSPGTCKVTENIILGIFATLGNGVLWMMSWFLTLAGILLNVSILLTMNIKAIYEATPAIEQVWVVIRNISSIFIIFFLIYTSIMTIVGSGTTSVQKLIGKIVIAGLLINFSLFFTRMAIDASNLVSLELYKAIAPQSQNTILNSSFDGKSLLSSSYYDGGISNIFQQSLKIPTIYNSKKDLITETSDNSLFKIAVSTIAGSILMIFAALSFLAASVAFVVRLVVLLLLMGFSPIYFVGMIFPQVEKEISQKWMGWLTKELIFMPVYLLFMYVALRFLSSENEKGFFALLDTGRQGAGNESTGGVLLSTVGLFIQYTIAFVLINVPLIAALQTGGIGMKWGESAKKWVGGYVGGGVGQNTIGRAAKWSSDKLNSSGIAAKNPNLAIMANKTFGKVASSTFGGSKGGYEKRFKDYSKAREDYANKNINLGSKEKNIILATGMSEWDNRKKYLENEISKKQTLIADGTSSEKEIRDAQIELVKLQKEQTARKKAFDEGTQNKYLEGEALKAKKEQYAQNLEKQSFLGFFTNKARKEAADSFRKEANKSEDKKLLEKLQKLAKDAEKASEPEKPKPPTA